MKEVSTTASLAALFYGFYFSTILIGIVFVVGWKYFHTNKDGWILRLLVTSSIVLVIIAGGCKVAVVHHFMVRNFGNPNIVKTNYVMINVTFVITGSIFFLVHIFFASRLWLLTSNRWLPGSIVLLSTAMLGFNAYGGSANPVHQLARVQISTLLFHLTAVINDILVMLGFSVYFHLKKPIVISQRTATVVQRLLNFVMTRVILLCAIQIVHSVMYMVWHTDYLFWLSLHLVLDPLNVITMLVILNSRPHQRDAEIEDPVIDLDFAERAPSQPVSGLSLGSSGSSTYTGTEQ